MLRWLRRSRPRLVRKITNFMPDGPGALRQPGCRQNRGRCVWRCPMEAGGGGVRLGPDPFPRAEIVHCSERTRVTRLFLPGRRTVIRKEPLGPDAEGRVRHEVAMLERLRGVAGVAQPAEAPRYPGPVVLEDAGE